MVRKMSKYSNSELVDYIKLSPNHSGQRTHTIDTITIHCVAGNATVEVIGQIFAPTSRQASSQYGIGSDGRIGMYCEEKNRSWCTSSKSNDQRAITIEVANDSAGPLWHVSDAAMDSLIKLVADICKRNGIKELKWCNDKSLIGQIDKQNMTVHQWYANKACPGNYLLQKHPYIVEEVNKLLKGEEVIELNMTKVELVDLIKSTVKSMGVGEPASDWATKDIENAKSKKITDGSNPQRMATRQEVMVISERVIDYIEQNYAKKS